MACDQPHAASSDPFTIHRARWADWLVDLVGVELRLHQHSSYRRPATSLWSEGARLGRNTGTTGPCNATLIANWTDCQTDNNKAGAVQLVSALSRSFRPKKPFSPSDRQLAVLMFLSPPAHPPCFLPSASCDTPIHHRPPSRPDTRQADPHFPRSSSRPSLPNDASYDIALVYAPCFLFPSFSPLHISLSCTLVDCDGRFLMRRMSSCDRRKGEAERGLHRGGMVSRTVRDAPSPLMVFVSIFVTSS